MIYLAGPIDYGGDPESRHRLLEGVIASLPGPKPGVYCPSCSYVDAGGADFNVNRNMEALEKADVMVVDWTAAAQPSFGTPIEVYHKANRGGRIVVIGTLGHGLFATLVRENGAVTEISSWSELAPHISQGPYVLVEDQDGPLITIGGQDID